METYPSISAVQPDEGLAVTRANVTLTCQFDSIAQEGINYQARWYLGDNLEVCIIYLSVYFKI